MTELQALSITSQLDAPSLDKEMRMLRDLQFIYIPVIGDARFVLGHRHRPLAALLAGESFG